MAYDTNIRGIHLEVLLQDRYGFRHPDLPLNLESWRGVDYGTVNSNYVVELQMPAVGHDDVGWRRMIVTMIEAGGADAVPHENLGYYTSLMRHVGERSLDIYPVEDKERLFKWVEGKAREIGFRPGTDDTTVEGIQALTNVFFVALNPDRAKALRGEFIEFKRIHGINPVKFRVPLPFHAQGMVANPDTELGPLYVDFEYKLLAGGGVTHGDYNSLTGVETAAKPVVVFPFLTGVSPETIIKTPLRDSLAGIDPNEYLEMGRSPLEVNRRKYLPLRICHRVGQALAAFHRTTEEGFEQTLENRMGVGQWADLLQEIRGKKSLLERGNISPGMYDQLQRQVRPLIEKWMRVEGDLPRGQIHGDMFPDNVVLSGLGHDTGVQGTLNVGIIDPWAAGTDALLLDIGICLAAWCTTSKGNLLQGNAQAFLTGYDSVRPRTPLEVENTLLAARVGSTRFALTRAHMRVQDQPATIQRSLRHPGEYLLKAHLFTYMTRHDRWGLEPTHEQGRGR